MKLIQRYITGSSCKLQRCGLITATLRTTEGTITPIAIPSSLIKRLPYKQLQTFGLNGSKALAIPTNWQINPLTREIQHIDYVMLNKQLMINKVPILFISTTNVGNHIKPASIRVNAISGVSIMPNYVKVDMSSFDEGITPTITSIVNRFQRVILFPADANLSVVTFAYSGKII